MSVDESLGRLPFEFQLPTPGLLLFNNEFFEKERCFTDICGVVTFNEVRILVTEREDATRLTSNNGVAALDERMELANVEIRVRARGFREAFRDHRAPAALSLGKTNLVAGRFEQLYGSLSDFRIVVIDKRVMEEDDFSGGQLVFRISSLRLAAF